MSELEVLTEEELQSLEGKIASERERRRLQQIAMDRGYEIKISTARDEGGDLLDDAVDIMRGSKRVGFIYRNKLLLNERMDCDDVVFIIDYRFIECCDLLLKIIECVNVSLLGAD